MIRRKQHIIQLIRQKVNEIDNTAEVILYGSRARGDNKRDSDWDVMILLNRSNVDKKVELTFSLEYILLICDFTVLSSITKKSAISLLDLPSNKSP